MTLEKSAPKRVLSDMDSELLNINFFETPTTFKELIIKETKEKN